MQKEELSKLLLRTIQSDSWGWCANSGTVKGSHQTAGGFVQQLFKG